jgi:spermidine synthase
MDPSSLQANRFFTKEFFSLVKKRLNKAGILVLGAPGSLMYGNEELKNLNSCILHTLKHVFPHIRVIPGDGKNLFLSSDSQDVALIKGAHVVERLFQRKIRTNLIVPWHLEKKLHSGWQDWFKRFLEGSDQKINSDFKPLGLFYSISHWNALFAPSLSMLFRLFEMINIGFIALTLAFILLGYVIFRARQKRPSRAAIPLSIATTGFAGMIFDLTLIFTFQSMYGYVFTWIGLLVSFFMVGAACGAIYIARIQERINNCFELFVAIDLTIICFSFGWPFLFLGLQAYLENSGAYAFIKVLFLVIACICGLLIGSQYPLANRIYLRNNSSLSKTAGLLYASDLLGGWFGGIVGAVVLLPVLGLTRTCITVGLLKLTSFIVLTTQPGRHLSGGKPWKKIYSKHVREDIS